MGSGPNKQLKITLEMVYTNGNPNKRTMELPASFKTKDSKGKLVFFNRGRAMNDLIYFLLDHRFIRPASMIMTVMNYDRKIRKKEGFLKANVIEIADEITFSDG